MVGLAELYVRQGKSQDALALLEEAAKAHQASALPFLSIAQLY